MKAGMNCRTCAELGGYQEIENSPDAETPSEFPKAYSGLGVPAKDLALRDPDEALLKCSQCAQFYLYRRWSPGGSEDALRTTVYEAVYPIGLLEVHLKLEQAESDSLRWMKKYSRDKSLGPLFRDKYRSNAAAIESVRTQLRKRAAEIVDAALVKISAPEAPDRETARILLEYWPLVKRPSKEMRDRVARIEEGYR
jgi:hypothetical protein